MGHEFMFNLSTIKQNHRNSLTWSWFAIRSREPSLLNRGIWAEDQSQSVTSWCYSLGYTITTVSAVFGGVHIISLKYLKTEQRTSVNSSHQFTMLGSAGRQLRHYYYKNQKKYSWPERTRQNCHLAHYPLSYTVNHIIWYHSLLS